MSYPHRMDSGRSFNSVFHIVLLGDNNVGKTCVMNRFTSGIFIQTNSTIGVDFATKTLEIAGEKVKLAVWDTAGNESFRELTQPYLRIASGVIIVYDITNKHTFSIVPSWIDDVQKYAGDNVIKILIGNKKDRENIRQVDFSEAQALAAHHGMLECLETSVKDFNHIEQVFWRLGAELKRRQPGPLLEDETSF